MQSPSYVSDETVIPVAEGILIPINTGPPTWEEFYALKQRVDFLMGLIEKGIEFAKGHAMIKQLCKMNGIDLESLNADDLRL